MFGSLYDVEARYEVYRVGTTSSVIYWGINHSRDIYHNVLENLFIHKTLK